MNPNTAVDEEGDVRPAADFSGKVSNPWDAEEITADTDDATPEVKELPIDEKTKSLIDEYNRLSEEYGAAWDAADDRSLPHPDKPERLIELEGMLNNLGLV